MSFFFKEEAEKLICPQISNPGQNVFCIADQCLWWEYINNTPYTMKEMIDPMEKERQKYLKEADFLAIGYKKEKKWNPVADGFVLKYKKFDPARRCLIAEFRQPNRGYCKMVSKDRER